MNIKKVPISEVEVWDKNPRDIETKDFERLKKQIKELGIYKPLICARENGKFITLGGNMRLRALQELKLEEVDISIVKAPDDAMRLKYALSDNDRAGQYDEQALAELAHPLMEEIDLEDYKLDIGKPMSLKTLMEITCGDAGEGFDLPNGEEPPFRIMTFYLLNEQEELVKEAIKRSKKDNPQEGRENENSNANALEDICRSFIDGC